MTRAPLRVGIVGAGTISTAHARSLQAIECARLVGFADLNSAADMQARQFGARPFRELAQLLAEVDAVTICTPVETHAAVAIEALSAGKHVLIEKPMARSLAQCDQMIAAAQRGSAQLAVIYQQRFNRYANRLKWLLDSGRMGRQVFSVANQSSTHGWDTMRFVVGEPAEVSAHWSGEEHTFRDPLLVSIKFANGRTGLLETLPIFEPAGIPSDRRIWLYCLGERLTARFTMFSWELVLAGGDEAYKRHVEREIADLFTGPAYGEGHSPDNRNNVPDIVEQFNECHRPQIEAWVQALQEGRPAPVPGAEGRKTIEFHTAAYQSGLEGRPITLPIPTDDPWYANPPRSSRG